MNKYNLDKYFIIYFTIFFFNSCTVFFTKSPFDKIEKDLTRICFWSLPGLTISSLQSKTTGIFIHNFLIKCDTFILTDLNPNIDFSNSIEKIPLFEDLGFICLEGNPKVKLSSKAKSLLCIRNEYSPDIEKIEYEELLPSYTGAPTIFLLDIADKKVLIIAYQGNPGIKSDLRNLQTLVDFSNKNFSDRRIFIGGSFYLDQRYQALDFLVTLPYFLVYKEMIDSVTTSTGEKNDSIFTDPRSSKGCKGKVWNLEEFTINLDFRRAFENISEHYPVSIDCNFN